MTERQASSRSCFVCGRDNDVGLKMVWENHLEDGEIRSAVTVSEQFNGYPGVVHGGILAAMLDETAGRSILLEGDPDELMVEAASVLVGTILMASGITGGFPAQYSSDVTIVNLMDRDGWELVHADPANYVLMLRR